MVKKALLCGVVISIFLIGSVVTSSASEDAGPADMILQAVKDKDKKKPKPSVFPHAKHQESITCGECHHAGEPGNKTPYVEGMKVEKCETCHFIGSGMPSKKDKKKKIKKLDTYKHAAHQNCKGCHKKVKKEKPELKTKWKKCLPCHVKK